LIPFNFVQVSFTNKKLAKLLNSEKEIVKANGADNGRRIARRLQNIVDASNLAELAKIPQTRVHQLTGDRNEQISVDVKHPYRLLLICGDEEPPRKSDGGLDWNKITKVIVIGIEDTH